MNAQTQPTPAAPKYDRGPYLVAGFNSRREYLKSLAEEYDVPYANVLAMASALGPSEDFDGLVTSLEDGEGNWF